MSADSPRDADETTPRLHSVNVAQPRAIGVLRGGTPVVSGIAQHAVSADSPLLTALNPEGDRQADLTVHGGPDKTVSAYQAEHPPR